MILNKVEDTLKSIAKFIDASESIIINIISKVSPWAAPFPTAYLVYDRTMLHLGWPSIVSLIAAVTIEALGLATTSTTLRLYHYNKVRKKIPPDWEPTILASGRKSRYRGRIDPPAPTWIPTLLTALYVITAEGLTVALDIATKWGSITAADLAPAVFPFISLAGMALLAVQDDHSQRLGEIAEATKPKPKSTPKPKKPTIPTWAIPHQCKLCGWWPGKDKDALELPEHYAQMIGGHTKSHYTEARSVATPLEAAELFKAKYPDATEYPSAIQIAKWRKEES